MYSCEFLQPLEGVPTALQVVFAGHEDGDRRLASEGLAKLVEAYNQRVPPSRLLFVCPLGIESQLQRAFEERRDEFTDRLASASHVVIAPYGKDGRLAADIVLYLKGSAASWAIEDALLEDIVRRAVSEILDQTNTILNAPHGYAFRKPSSREEDIFVRAGNLLRDPASLPVFSYLLLRRLPLGCCLVYLDSFTILSFALGLQSLVDYFRRGDPNIPALAIENFHSHQVAREFRIPNDVNYLVLISASTSGGLANRLVSEKQADPTRIIHLLGVGPAESEFRHSCVFFREREPTDRESTRTSGRDSVIEIATEEFLVAQGSPTPVRITLEHVNRKGADELHKSVYGEALRFQGSTLGGSYSPFSMSSDLADLHSSSFLDWISETLVHELPASLRAIVHAGDSGSEQFASWVRNALPGDVVLVAHSDINGQLEASLSGGSAIVVAYQDPGLERLRAINIALRSIDPVHRHYVVGYAYPESKRGYDRAKQDLRMGPEGRKYGWSDYLALPVGAAVLHESLQPLTASFNDEVLEPWRAVLGDSLFDALSKRNAQPSIPRDGLFLPRSDGSPLKLRHGSIFFSTTAPETISQIAVHAMVSAAVQAAREDRSALPRFDDNPFVRSVLDPSMFARFSDGILQASLLRSTQRSELDYSASKELSRQFATACESVLANHGNDVGDAALEFVHAVATRKVSMRDSDLKGVEDCIDGIPILRAFRELLAGEGELLP